MEANASHQVNLGQPVGTMERWNLVSKDSNSAMNLPHLLSRAVMSMLLLALIGLGLGCNGKGDSGEGRIRIDGSSTVFPIAEAVAEEFQRENPTTRVLVGISGTGGGFQKFASGEIDIVDASRPIKEEEKERAAANNVEYVELIVAFDGLSVIVNRGNDFVDSLTVAELKKLWEPGSKINTWQQLRPDWPDEEIILFGPGTDSGTFDYFTETIVGKEDASRSDYTASEDDNVLVEGVSNEPNGIGYFGFAYYTENKEKLKVVPIDGGDGPVSPSVETISSNEYSPLSRPLYIYVSEAALEKAPVKEFVWFFLTEAGDLVQDIGYVALPDSQVEEELEKLERF